MSKISDSLQMQLNFDHARLLRAIKHYRLDGSLELIHVRSASIVALQSQIEEVAKQAMKAAEKE